jgi:methionyl-tRNA formyltransferase
MDGGDIYLQKDFKLTGSAKEIYRRVGDIICKRMIPEIIENDLKPKPQTEGNFETFKRRHPHQSVIDTNVLVDPGRVYDFIRMLDADGYPRAFFDRDGFRFEFSDASFGEDFIDCRCRIYKSNVEKNRGSVYG